MCCKKNHNKIFAAVYKGVHYHTLCNNPNHIPWIQYYILKFCFSRWGMIQYVYIVVLRFSVKVWINRVSLKERCYTLASHVTYKHVVVIVVAKSCWSGTVQKVVLKICAVSVNMAQSCSIIQSSQNDALNSSHDSKQYCLCCYRCWTRPGVWVFRDDIWQPVYTVHIGRLQEILNACQCPSGLWLGLAAHLLSWHMIVVPRVVFVAVDICICDSVSAELSMHFQHRDFLQCFDTGKLSDL